MSNASTDFTVRDDPRDPHVRANWDAVLARLAHQLLPTDFAGFVDAFAARQRSVVPAIEAHDAALARYEETNDLLLDAASATQDAILALVKLLLKAGLATTVRLFGRFLSCSMATLQVLDPPWQIGAVRCLHRRLHRADDVTPEMRQAADVMLRAAQTHHETAPICGARGREHYAAERTLNNEIFEWRRMARKLKWSASWYWRVDSPEYRAIFQMSERPSA